MTTTKKPDLRLKYKVEHRRKRREDPEFRERENARMRERRRIISLDPKLVAKQKAKQKEIYWSRPQYWRARSKLLDAQRKSSKAGRPAPARCECCGDMVSGKQMHWDHNHRTQEFRGWICHWCNVSIGLMRESPDRIMKLLLYLKSPPGFGPSK